ncbi:ATP-binding protein [Ferrovibrio sp.]|uniref:ATP-binding protein n=1 Tax=Ferrovibrio sp. TaxID=1917215 RepID=UPI001B718EE1|nr:ATP-binding protein [Ferrovibrio sp.]MBP7063975.1 HAMP domain-containing protein [Ferrovibrio sp.]
MKLPFWSRLRLAPRIGLVIIGGLLAVKAVDKLLPLVIRPPEIMFFDRDWLLANLADMRDRSLAVSAAERPAALRDLPVRRWLDITSLSAEPDFRHGSRLGAFADLHLQIAATLALAPQDVLLMADDLDDPEYSPRPLVIILPPLPIVMADVLDERRSNMLSSDLRIAFRIGPQDWLLVTPKSDGQETVRMIRNVLLPLFAVVMIGLLSIWVARGVVKPLDDLAAAAEKLGRDRELSLVGNFNAPELQAIGSSFNAMQLRLKRFVDDRLQMIAAISHDLRTPLTRLRLFAEYLPDQEQRRQLLSDIDDMETMMSATLTFASNQLKDEPRSAADLAAMLISLCDTAADAGHAVSYDGPDHAGLICQPVAIRRAFANLIDNGCKFADHVRVGLHDAADCIIITVADDGPGIPADQVETAFRPFTRLESSRNRETGGTGLGLTIARDVFLAHRGSIELSMAVPAGLLVSVRLPKSAG